MRRLLFAWVLVLLCASGARAQFETGGITGTVRDNSGGVLPGVTVTLTNLDTGVVQTATTNDSGLYEFFTLRLGRYEVRAELSGFTAARVPEVSVGIGSRQRVDVELGVGALTEAIEVSAASLGLERDSSQRGQSISGEQAVALPLNGREYSALALLTTGVRASALNTGGLTPREGSFNVNGLRSTANNFLLDGVDNNAYGTSNQGFSNQVMQPPPDAIAEFRVVTNNMSAEYGRSAGGTVNVAYKSGTNRFSGAGWEFRRDTSLNAIGFFRPVAGNEPQLDRDQYGFVLGGPILKNKAFFFTDYEGFRETQKVVSLASIPTMEQRQGILTLPVRDPRTGVTYAAGTQIPMTPFARKVLNELPAPTSAGISNNFRRVRLFETDIDKYNVKLDGRVNDKHSVAFAGVRLLPCEQCLPRLLPGLPVHHRREGRAGCLVVHDRLHAVVAVCPLQFITAWTALARATAEFDGGPRRSCSAGRLGGLAGQQLPTAQTQTKPISGMMNRYPLKVEMSRLSMMLLPQWIPTTRTSLVDGELVISNTGEPLSPSVEL
jgi:hypothetical protein